MGVCSGCGCKEVYRFPHITYPYSSCMYLFFYAAASLLFVHVFRSFAFFKYFEHSQQVLHHVIDNSTYVLKCISCCVSSQYTLVYVFFCSCVIIIAHLSILSRGSRSLYRKLKYIILTLHNYIILPISKIFIVFPSTFRIPQTYLSRCHHWICTR